MPSGLPTASAALAPGLGPQPAPPAAAKDAAHATALGCAGVFTTATNSVFMPVRSSRGGTGRSGAGERRSGAAPPAAAAGRQADGDGDSSGYEDFRTGAAVGTAASNATPRSAMTALTAPLRFTITTHSGDGSGTGGTNSIAKGADRAGDGLRAVAGQPPPPMRAREVQDEGEDEGMGDVFLLPLPPSGAV